MRQAIALAIQNVDRGRGGPFACLVVKDGEIIARGTNLVTSTNDPTAHAEVVAIRRACHELGSFQLDGCELYTTCEPCPMCLGAIYWARPTKIYFAADRHDAASSGFDDRHIYEEISEPPEARSITMERLLRDEALEAFRRWRDDPNAVAY